MSLGRWKAAIGRIRREAEEAGYTRAQAAELLLSWLQARNEPPAHLVDVEEVALAA